MIQTLTPRQAHALILRGEVEVVDVREPAEWSGGHIAGARLVPLESLRANAKALLPHDGILFVCAAGVRSQTAARVAAANGLARVYNLSGGIRNWANTALPLVTELSESA